MVIDPVVIRRFRGSKKRLERLKLTRHEKIEALLLAAFCLLATVVSAWLIANFRD